MFSKRAPILDPDAAESEGLYVQSERGGAVRRVLTIPLTVTMAALLALTVIASGGGAVEQVAGGEDTPAAAAACDEATLRDAISESSAVSPDLVYEVTYLKCAEGYGWAVITANGDGAIIFLTISDAGMTLLDLGSGICAPEAGIPADVAAKIAPPGEDPTGGCPVEPEAAKPIEKDAHFTG